MRTKLFLFPVLALALGFGCQTSDRLEGDPAWEKAISNGQMANEGYQRCYNFVNEWLKYADPETGLIPRNLTVSKDIWNGKDAAADNYPFMVLTAALVDHDLYNGKMRAMLEAEQKYTNRWDRLPDTYSFSKKGFDTEQPNKDDIIFGSAEYIKDGLLPLTEYTGITPWSERMIDIIDDIWKHAEYPTPYGNIPSLNVEVNGDLLQVLSRVFWMTVDKKYLEWATRLGQYYLVGDNHPTKNFKELRLRDHGCEIISGLCEFYIAVSKAEPEKKELFKEPIYEMLDRILEVGRNEHGMFYNLINPVTGEILDNRIADTYGYTFNAYYGVYLLDNHAPYRDAVIKALQNLDHYREFKWEIHDTGLSADGYADAIESALNLYNREQINGVDEWVESQIKFMWSLQDSSYMTDSEPWRGNGIIEGWHGDGNFARTTIMFNLWKTQGATLYPWNSELVYGAINEKGAIKLALTSENEWEGIIKFDVPRHTTIFHLPLDYPRINQFPEWFTVEEDKNYEVVDLTKQTSTEYTGTQLANGIPLKLPKGGRIFLQISEKQKNPA